MSELGSQGTRAYADLSSKRSTRLVIAVMRASIPAARDSGSGSGASQAGQESSSACWGAAELFGQRLQPTIIAHRGHPVSRVADRQTWLKSSEPPLSLPPRCTRRAAQP